MVNVPNRLIAFAQNATEVVRYGGLRTDDQTHPYEVVARWENVALRRYFPDRPATGPAFLLVHPLMMSAEMWDVAPAVSCVGSLYESGIDPWVIDYGRPETSPEILERTLSDLVVTLDGAVDLISVQRGSDVFVGGYSQGGMLAYQVAAYRSTKGVAGVVSFGAPVDFRGGLPAGVSPEVIAKAGKVLGTVGRRVSVPGWLTRNAFRLVDPVKATKKQVDFLLALHDRDALLPREGQRRFIDGDGWLTAPGPALAEFAQQFLEHNRMLQGGIVVNGVALSLADITCPMLAVIGDSDLVASAGTIRPLKDAAPNSDTWEAHVTAGHLGLVLGSRSQAQAWPAIIEFVDWISRGGPEPQLARRIADVAEQGLPDLPEAPKDPGATALLNLLASSAAGAGRNAVRTLESASTQARRLARVQSAGSDGRESLALTLDEQAAKSPDRIQFLYQGVAVTRADAKVRIDAVTRGLLHIGVHQGDHVGVLMNARPSAVSAAAAVNRIGAVSVMLRPGFGVTREADLGDVKIVLCDPERVDEALSTGRPVYVLGGGSANRPTLPPGVMDLETLDVESTAVPAWFAPNPGRGAELAFILFTGTGCDLRIHRVTNHRWVLSAYGTAAAAALSERDTVYCLTPPSHMSGLLVSIGGAIAGDARFAMADGFDPDLFWEEVRRYGVTVVSYTWSSLQALVDAPPRRAEVSHSIRLFVGSGMPPALWRRVVARFKAGVVGFYTAPGEAVLVNLGNKPGALGRPLPGASRVRVVTWSEEADEPVRNADGWPVVAGVGEPGMLLAEVSVDDQATHDGGPEVVRGVLTQGDAWIASGDLAVRDEDGDIWWLGARSQNIDGESGTRSPSKVRDALEAIGRVRTAVAYAVDDQDRGVLVVAAVELAPRASLDGETLSRALAEVADDAIPDVVRVVGSVPRTYLHRPIAGVLADEGVPAPTKRRPVFVREGCSSAFEPA